jgi:hypothetical protein
MWSYQNTLVIGCDYAMAFKPSRICKQTWCDAQRSISLLNERIF